MNKKGSFLVGFCDRFVKVTYNCSQAASLLEFLFSDQLADANMPVLATYDLLFVGREPMLSLWREDRHLYLGTSVYDLAYTLMNEVIYQGIQDNNAGLAIHAAGVSIDGQGVLLPGKSGSGKSTLATWLVARKCTYLSDELVVVSAHDDHLMIPFTRPISLKQGSVEALAEILPKNGSSFLRGANGLMLAHRQINRKFSYTTPPLRAIVFPKYQKNTVAQITRMSGAMACAKLMESYVNARNIDGHGMAELARICRSIPSYRLTYGQLNSLPNLLAENLPVRFPWTTD